MGLDRPWSPLPILRFVPDKHKLTSSTHHGSVKGRLFGQSIGNLAALETPLIYKTNGSHLIMVKKNISILIHWNVVWTQKLDGSDKNVLQVYNNKLYMIITRITSNSFLPFFFYFFMRKRKSTIYMINFFFFFSWCKDRYGYPNFYWKYLIKKGHVQLW